jgi:transposase InsO family protein
VQAGAQLDSTGDSAPESVRIQLRWLSTKEPRHTSTHLDPVPHDADHAAAARVDGRVGSCYVNAVAESFFASLKAEIGTRVFATRADVRRAAFAYINCCNRNRLHSTLKQQTPHEAESATVQPIALAA